MVSSSSTTNNAASSSTPTPPTPPTPPPAPVYIDMFNYFTQALLAANQLKALANEIKGEISAILISLESQNQKSANTTREENVNLNEREAYEDLGALDKAQKAVATRTHTSNVDPVNAAYLTQIGA